MSGPVSTCWTLIHGAAAGVAGDRAEFARRYAPVVVAYLRARWKGTPHLQELEDAVQDVFVDCFKHDGALTRVEPGRPGGFRGFLYGVTRNIGLRVESGHSRSKEQQPPTGLELDAVARRERSLTRAFDRAWAKAVMREALTELRRGAAARGEGGELRYELLRQRYQDGLALNEIARRRGIEPTMVYREFGRAKADFRNALLAVVAAQDPEASRAEVESACLELLSLLE